ncbi:hypothetical protein [Mycolicibacterium tusciae]|uniref:hypothetical protein n=1 Tax=Mycolicibacterium tusciae TaxID=75922 RepID=UPI0010565D79|nr:hypothetical protein [Mycolicibacterium tusciae]
MRTGVHRKHVREPPPPCGPGLAAVGCGGLAIAEIYLADALNPWIALALSIGVAIGLGRIAWALAGDCAPRSAP